ncbi:type II secretion system F family protein [Hyphomicrobium sp.]|uniref:type II secretion system F family protein n=1 Tax=Hyphomicrobium sp. TaxID=82 RepID=UPI000FC2B802|nr:type II secretion system F family protein [Hyphomicrobium sp.]RUO99752.1 MAG: type II secretion system F family protein [Hyphomicrobium sp.]
MADLDLGFLAPILIALAFAGAVFAVAYPYFSDDRQKEKRVEIAARTRDRRAQAAADIQSSRKKSVAETLKEIETREKASKKITMSLRLLRAGSKRKPRDFYVISALMGLLFAVIAVGPMGWPPMAGLVAAFVGGFGFPRWFLNKMTTRRQNKFLSHLANAIDVIVRGIKSGLPVNECMNIIARESPEPLAGEFRELVDQQKLGVSLADGLDRMCDRMPLPEVRFLTIVISIQQQAGGNLSEALSNLASVLRDRHSLSLKVKALAAEAKASAAVLAALPPGVMTMVYLSSPDYLRPLFTTTVGHFLVAFGGLWMMTGVLIMRKMINFKF